MSALPTLLLACFLLPVIKSDVCERTIPNKQSFYILLISLFIALIHGRAIEGLQSASIVLLAGAVLFYLRVWGAGDSKLAAALALALPLAHLVNALIYMAVIGGVVAMICLMQQLIWPSVQRRGVPYGIAITSGFYLEILATTIPV